MSVPTFSSLRTTVILCVVVSFIAVAGATSYLFSQLLAERFSAVERAAMEEELKQGHQFIARLSYALRKTVTDWGWWDDTYRFMADENPTYAGANFLPEVLGNINVHTALYIDSDGHIKSALSFDTSGSPRSTEVIAAYMLAHPSLFRFSKTEDFREGLLQIPNAGNFIVGSAPITTSARKGPLRGTLLFLRSFGSREVDELKEATQLDFSFTSVPVEGPVGGPHKAGDISVQVLGTDQITGSLPLLDVFGVPLGELVLKRNRPMHQIGLAAKDTAITLVALSLMVFGAAITLLIEWRVISRIQRFRRELQEVTTSQDLSCRVTVAGDDELSDLARAANILLETIEGSYKSVEEGRNALYSQTESLIKLTDELKLAHRSTLSSTKAKDSLLLSLQLQVEEPLSDLETAMEQLLGSYRTELSAAESAALHEKTLRLGHAIRDALQIAELHSGPLHS